MTDRAHDRSNPEQTLTKLRHKMKKTTTATTK